MLKNHNKDDGASVSGSNLDNSSSKMLSSDEPWQSIGPLDIQFSLVFSAGESSHSLSVLLPCQCIQADFVSNATDCIARDFSSVRFCIALGNETEQIALTDHTDVALKLKHQRTWVEVLGRCSDYDRVNNAISFAFDDPASMQARMILQLVKICQMKADLLIAEQQGPTENNTARSVENHDNDISHAAKTWSDQFAADFAKKFDKNN